MKRLLPPTFSLIALFTLSAFSQDFAVQRLNESPRHHEWVSIKAGKRMVKSFVVYPEKKNKATALIVIHENRGLTDWVRSFADQAAEAGYVAIAPDLLTHFSENFADTTEFETSDDARSAIYELDDAQVMKDLAAVRDYAASLPSSNGKVAVSGFCWGGSKSFLFATKEKDIEAVLTFYGSPPDKERQLKKISAPVYGFYGEDDNRINSQLPKTEERMKKLGKFFEPVIYPGAGHAFMRHGDDPEGSEANKAARDKAWERVKEILEKI